MIYTISGSRSITDEKAVEGVLSGYLAVKDEVLVGDARGVDKIAAGFAHRRWCQVRIFKADWDHHGKSAGPIRNKQMASEADVLVAIWDGKSRGTKNMILTCLELGVETHVHFV